MLSDRKLAANRRNALKSTGPRSTAGKKRSARNATTHGIYCRDTVLDWENQTLFHAIREDFIRTLQPQNALELSLVDRIVQNQWHINRLNQAESKLYEMREDTLRDIVERRKIGELSVPDCRDRQWEKIDQVIDPMDEQKFQCYLAAMGLGFASTLSLMGDDDRVLERYQNLRQKLELSSSRALRELRLLRTVPKRQRKLLPSPYAADAPMPADVIDEQDRLDEQLHIEECEQDDADLDPDAPECAIEDDDPESDENEPTEPSRRLKPADPRTEIDPDVAECTIEDDNTENEENEPTDPPRDPDSTNRIRPLRLVHLEHQEEQDRARDADGS